MKSSNRIEGQRPIKTVRVVAKKKNPVEAKPDRRSLGGKAGMTASKALSKLRKTTLAP